MRTLTYTLIHSFFMVSLIVFFSCSEENNPDPKNEPTVSTNEVINITSNSAQCSGIIAEEDLSSITEKGFCWSTDSTPTINDNTIIDTTQSVNYTCTINGLQAETTYFIRAYAKISSKVGYGEIISFTTNEEHTTVELPAIVFNPDKTYGTVTDYEGNEYKTIQIGEQVWMAENLRAVTYANGDSIGSTSNPNTDIQTETEPKYQWAYNGNETYVSIYGRLYTWYAAMDSRGVCPSGWHIPSVDEWNILKTAVGGEEIMGGELKEVGYTHWKNPNTGATNSSGFTALPGGSRDDDGTFAQMGEFPFWWTSTTVDGYNEEYAWMRAVYYEYAHVFESNNYKRNGVSIRCIQD